MDRVSELIDLADKAGLSLSVVGDKLEIEGPKSAEGLVRQIFLVKPAVIARLVGPTSFSELLATLDADGRLALEERAAIIEEGSKCSRAESEAKALEDWRRTRGN